MTPDIFKTKYTWNIYIIKQSMNNIKYTKKKYQSLI